MPHVVAPGPDARVPAAHGRQVVELGVALKRPAGHTGHDVEPAPDADPAGHGTHVAFELAPSTALRVPAGHWVHVANDVAPTSSLYVPAGHGEHSLEPDAAKVPAGHTLHSSEPGERAKDPASHTGHASARIGEALADPGSHGTHSNTPGEACVPAGHSAVQTVAPAAE